jgi:hypothetical protein
LASTDVATKDLDNLQAAIFSYPDSSINASPDPRNDSSESALDETTEETACVLLGQDKGVTIPGTLIWTAPEWINAYAKYNVVRNDNFTNVFNQFSRAKGSLHRVRVGSSARLHLSLYPALFRHI